MTTTTTETTETTEARAECHCIIRHPVTPEERAAMVKSLEEGRRIGDMSRVQLLLCSLTTRCPATSKGVQS